MGATLATGPAEIYRALIEATAFGTRMIIEAFEAAGMAINELVTCGGLPERNPLLMQIYADVTGRVLKVGESLQAPALGSAMFGAVAAGSTIGGYDSIIEATASMARLRATEYVPNLMHRDVYDELFAEYRLLHDYFGRGSNDVMKRLKAIRSRTVGASAAG